MTAFNKNTDLPDSVNTLEKLIVWAVTCFQHLNSEALAIEAAGGQDRVAISQPWFISASTPPSWRNISRESVQLSPNWQRGGKIWTHALEIPGSAQIPSEFKTN